ncbi:MAG: ATP-binding protein [Ignavibacteriaceae bacterium]
MRKLKTKILVGLIFLLAVILILSITGTASIYFLSQDSKAIVKDNYASVEYSTNMLGSIDNIFVNHLALIENKAKDKISTGIIRSAIKSERDIFERNLNLQKGNITEVGEVDRVSKLINSYRRFISLIDSSDKLANPDTYTLNELKSEFIRLTSSISEIYKINMVAILRKNRVANETADRVFVYMAVAASASVLLTLIFIFYFPSYITSPIKELTQKIEDISNKKYDQSIIIKSNDELNTLAAAFNKMAKKLKEYEAQHIDELLFEKRRMETLVTNLRDGTLLLDNDLNILLVNDKFCEITGLRKNELLGEKLTELNSENLILGQIKSIDILKNKTQLPEIIKPLKILIGDQVEYFQILLLDINKESKKESMGAPKGYILLIQNITKYEERDLAKTNLIATISHELKTPLSSINISLKLLEDERIGNLNVEQKELVESIKSQSLRILSLINEVLDFTQAETGHIKLNIKPCKVNDIIELGVFAILMLLNEKEINLKVSIPDKLAKVKCDLEKTVWVVVNILNNAIRYSAKKGSINIEAKEENRFVIISVEDEGPGITKEEQKMIFEKYVKSKSESTKGTGLGLAIAKEFVEVQGGKIGVESTYGSGSKLYFTLPLA